MKNAGANTNKQEKTAKDSKPKSGKTKTAKVPAKKILTVAEYEAQARAKDAAKKALPSERLGVPPTTPDVDAKVAAKAAQDAPTAAPKTEPKAKTPKAKDAPKTRKPGGLDAAVQVLTEAKEPLGCKEMVERMLAQGLWQTNGKTPAATIYAAILREITTKGDASRFRKTDRGRFALAG